MNKYLLLRDNKQSGPYTCQELQAKGIKAYDLVWIEGKSAAWRYPSEVEELKPYSPVIEEQPFERFFKKPVEETAKKPVEESADVRSRKEEILQPVKTDPGVKKIEKPIPPVTPSIPKKVYINFPASASPKMMPVTEAIPAKEQEKPTIRPTTVQQPVLADNSAIKNLTADSAGGSVRENQIKSGYNNYPTARKPSNRPLLTILAAACVLLIGVIIGLLYSYNATTEKKKELERLLQQMQTTPQQSVTSIEENNPGTSEPVDNSVALNEAAPTGSETVQNQVNAGILLSEEEKKPAPLQKSKKAGTTDLKVKTEANNTASNDAIAVPAILTEVEKPRTDLLEQNRKNIFQKVNIENNKFKVGVLGGINDLQLTLTNRSLFQLEQVEVEVKYLGSENKVVKTQTVYFTNVSPGDKLSLKVPKSNRGVSVDYSIKKISTKELGIASEG